MSKMTKTQEPQIGDVLVATVRGEIKIVGDIVGFMGYGAVAKFRVDDQCSVFLPSELQQRANDGATAWEAI